MERTHGSERISPTAHYTGYVWFAHGLSHQAFATGEGRLLYNALRPANAASRVIGGPTLEGMLLARHRVIDHLLEREIAAGRITQVIEIAAGLSPRGWRFTERHGRGLRYLEADLPEMAARKRAILAALGDRPAADHRVVDIDALADDGATSLAAIAAALDPHRGLAIVTEGLLNYFDTAAVTGMWRRFAAVLGRFHHGLYLADLNLAVDNRGPFTRTFQALLSAFVRGQVHFPFATADDARRALVDAGFAAGQPHPPESLATAVGGIEAAGARRVHIVCARA
jgi:O-methyltransferase involved in polyketide biosynthesis